MINQLDRDRASFERTLEALRGAYGRAVIPVQLPIGEERSFRGLVDLVRMKAYLYDPDGSGKGKEAEIPADLQDAATKAHEALVEMVAEGNDKLMEEFFEKGTIPVEDLVPGLKQAVGEKRIYPVAVSAGVLNIGSEALLNFLVDYLPSPLERGEVEGLDHEGGQPVKRKIADAQPVSAYVFKTVADPFAGRVSYFKVMSGVVKNEANLTNFNRGSSERLSHIGVTQGKTQTAVAELHAGDIGAVAKLKDTLTGDALGDKAAPIVFPKVKLAEPAISFAIEPKSRGDEDKLSTAIHRMLEEDLLLRFSRDPQTKEFLLSGAGQQHVEVAVSKLKRRFNIEVSLKAPKIPYRETIRAKAEAQGKHKKQTGGHGQYGDCWIKLEPQARGGGFRVRERHLRRRHSPQLHPRRRKRHHRGGGERLSGRLPGGRFQGHPLRRFLPRRRFLGNGLQAGGLQGLQEVHGAGQALPARTHHECGDSPSRKTTPATSWATSMAGAAAFRAWNRKGAQPW